MFRLKAFNLRCRVLRLKALICGDRIAHNEMTMTKKMIALLMSIMLVLAFTACGSGSEPEPEAEPEVQTEEQTEQTEQTEEQAPETTGSEEYNIASNLMLAGGGAEKAIDTDYFTITLTHGSSWDYEVDSNTSITIYNVASRDADYGGRLVSILAFDAGDTSYEVLPSYNVIGEKNGKVYIAEYPSDVQVDPSNDQAVEDYEAVFQEVKKIQEGAADSPLVLK